MVTDSTCNGQPLNFSLPHVQAAFAHEQVHVLQYQPPHVDAESTNIDDIYAWLKIQPAVPGWVLQDTVWVCASATEAELLALLRARALRHTNMGDLYAAPSELNFAGADSWQDAAYERLVHGASANQSCSGARRFVCCNLLLECSPQPRDAANQARTDRLTAILQCLLVGQSQR